MARICDSIALNSCGSAPSVTTNPFAQEHSDFQQLSFTLLKEKYSDIKFISKADWMTYEKERTRVSGGTTDETDCTLIGTVFIEDLDGVPYSKERASAVSGTAHKLFNEIMSGANTLEKKGSVPATWGQTTFVQKERVEKNLLSNFPELGFGLGLWKLRQVCTIMFSRWANTQRRNKTLVRPPQAMADINGGRLGMLASTVKLENKVATCEDTFESGASANEFDLALMQPVASVRSDVLTSSAATSKPPPEPDQTEMSKRTMEQRESPQRTPGRSKKPVSRVSSFTTPLLIL